MLSKPAFSGVPLAFRDDLKPSEWAQLVAAGHRREFKAGQPLILLGQRTAGLYLIEKGEAEVQIPRPGAEAMVHPIGAGELLGEMSLCTGRPASADVVARTPLQVLIIPSTELDLLLRRKPELRTRMHQAMSRLMVQRLGAQTPSSSVATPSRDKLIAACADVMAKIPGMSFSEEVEGLIVAYEGVAKRPRFLWCWVAQGLDNVTLSCVPHEQRDSLRDTKLMAVLMNVLLDDIADQRADRDMLNRALAMLTFPVPGAAPQEDSADADYLRLIRRLWLTVISRAKQLAGWERWHQLFLYDYQQVFNVMRYGVLLHEFPALVSTLETALYMPHNMNMMVFSTLDWMTAEIDPEELNLLREAMWHAQSMGQIGNSLATWVRELPDRDFSSWVIAWARKMNIISYRDLTMATPDDLADRLHAAHIEERVLVEWRTHRESLEELAWRVRSVDLHRLCHGSDILLGMNLASVGNL